MPKSMTGFGRASENFEDFEITVEIKSVNHRYFEFSSRISRQYSFLEERLKKLLSERISRGKTEIYVSVTPIGVSEQKVTANAEVIDGYISALRGVNERFGLPDDITLSSVMKIPDAFVLTKQETDEEALWEKVSKTATLALDMFGEMRSAEGEKLKSDILEKLCEIEADVDFVEKRSPQVNEQYRNRLYAKLKEVLGDRQIDDQRVLTEAALFADKTAVDEETVRLKSHISQYRSILEEQGPVGKRLDFLIQEFNREVNTIGSKCSDLEITKKVLEMKNSVEKIREQIQNIE